MAEIRNTITLDNQMSKILEDIRRDALGTIEAFGGFDKTFEAFEAGNEILSNFNEQMELMGVGFEGLKENIELMNEGFERSSYYINKAFEYSEEFKEVIEQTQKAISGSARAFDQAAGSVLDFARNVGLIPGEVADIGRGMLQVNNIMRASIPTAVKLAAALGPISLLASGLASAFGFLAMM